MTVLLHGHFQRTCVQCWYLLPSSDSHCHSFSICINQHRQLGCSLTTQHLVYHLKKLPLLPPCPFCYAKRSTCIHSTFISTVFLYPQYFYIHSTFISTVLLYPQYFVSTVFFLYSFFTLSRYWSAVLAELEINFFLCLKKCLGKAKIDQTNEILYR